MVVGSPFGHYTETYRKGDDGWRIASSTLTRLRMDITPPPEPEAPGVSPHLGDATGRGGA